MYDANCFRCKGDCSASPRFYDLRFSVEVDEFRIRFTLRVNTYLCSRNCMNGPPTEIYYEIVSVDAMAIVSHV